MDPNVSIYNNISGGQFHYGMQIPAPHENHTSFYRHYITDSNIVDPFKNRAIGNITMNSNNSHESVIKNYKHFENRQSCNTVKSCVPEVSNTYEVPTNQNYSQLRVNNTNLLNKPFSSVIQSTSQYETHYQNMEFQDRHNVQYIPNHIQAWEKNTNYFCKKLPDFSNVNMEVPSSKNQQTRLTSSNQHLVQFTTKYSDYKAEDVMKLSTNSPYTSYSSNKPLISLYKSIPQSSHNTQKMSRNCNINSALSLKECERVEIQNDFAHNYIINGNHNYNIIPEFSYNSCNSKSAFSNVSKLHSENISVPKPNYKEMINQVYNMKRSMTERELNMKIIERTLLSTNARSSASSLKQNHFNLKVPDSVRSSHLVSFHVPLDLSKKSVKTTADSTDCNLAPKTMTSQAFQENNETTNSAPKLDILPIICTSAEKMLNQEVPNAAINLTTSTIRISINESTSSRIRTKGELKVFNPNSTKCSQNFEVAIRHSDDYGLEKEIRTFNLFDWDDMCNKLLKQLKTSTFQQHNCFEKRGSGITKNHLNNRNLLQKKHKRELYNQKRLQNKESNSSDDESFDSLKIKKFESFRYWRSKKRRHFKYKNNNNNKINHNLVDNFGHKVESQPSITEDDYKNSGIDSSHYTSDFPSSISEKSTSKKKICSKRVLKIDGMITRSKSLMTRRKFNLRKRFGHIPTNEKSTKKSVNKNLLCKQKKTMNNHHFGQILGKRQLKCSNREIDWEAEMIKDKTTKQYIKKNGNTLILKKKTSIEARETILENTISKTIVENTISKTINQNLVSHTEQKLQQINEIKQNENVSAIEPTVNIQKTDSGHSSFERKYEEYITNVYNDSFENENIKNNMLKKKSSSRRKPSSGFDYIRKKKRLRPTILSPVSSIQSVRKSRTILKINKKIKTEKDIQSEIHKWVLNKSVGQTTLHKAARLGYIDVVCYCLERLNLNPNVKDNAGYTPLHEACSKGFIDIARCLLLYGADLSETAHSGIRPIHEASESGSMEIFRLLLEYGADPQITTYNGKSPYMLTESNSLRRYMETFLKDLQFISDKQSCRFLGPWRNIETDEETPLEDNLKNCSEFTFELEECDSPLPPLYQLKHISDNSKWVLLNDLSNLLNIKSKDKLLKYLYPTVPSSIILKDLTIEIKINDFIENAVCLQLLHAGEKIKIQSSKLTLVKYNDILRNVLKISKSVITL